MSIRVRYAPLPDRVLPAFGLWITQARPKPDLLAGYVCQDAGGKWSARLRGATLEHTTRGFPRRQDAAVYLLIAGQFCRQKPMKIAA